MGGDEPVEDGGRYELRDVLARGGGGRLVRAFDHKVGREVAIRLPDDDEEGVALAPRLEREARILAGLAHPAIVPIHDAGTWRDGRPFVAMRLLGGRTLQDAIGAARGLEARLGLLPVAEAIADAMAYAHAHGVVHRALAPATVLVGDLGDTVVTDWGMAGLIATDATEADPRTDVHALGAILHEILAGVPPRDGDGDGGLAAVEPRVRPALAAIVAKAMARSPGDRYCHAGELADDLRRYQAGRLVAAHRYSRAALARRWLRRRAVALSIAGAAAAIGLATAAALASRSAVTAEDTCRQAARPVQERWNPEVAARLAEAFRGTGIAHASSMFAVVRTPLEARAAQIGAMRVEACLAHARGAESGEALDLHMTCLDRRLSQLDAVLGALAAPDLEVIQAAPALVAGLGDVADCADLDGLAAVTPLPDDASQRLLLAGLRARLEQIGVAMDAGTIAELAPLDELLAQARGLGYAPLTALVLQRAGGYRIDRSREDRVLGEAQLRESILLAEAGGDDRVRLGSTVLLYGLVGRDRMRAREAVELQRQAEALVHRSGGLAELAALRSSQGTYHFRREEFQAAIARSEEAVTVLTAMPAPPRDKLALVHYRLAAALLPVRRVEDALAHLELAEAAFRQVYGDTHEYLGNVLDVRASALAIDGRFEEAVVMHQRAVAMEEAIAPASAGLASKLSNLGNILNQIDREDEAIVVFERGLRVIEALHGRDHPTYVSMLQKLSDSYNYRGDHDRALALLGEALASSNRTVGEDAAESIYLHYRIAENLRAIDRMDEAIAEYRRAIAGMERNREPNIERGLVLSGLGMALYMTKRWREAIVTFEQALPLLEIGRDPSVLGMAQIGLAEALIGAGRDRARAIALARSARVNWVASGDAQSMGLVAMVDDWLAKHDR